MSNATVGETQFAQAGHLGQETALVIEGAVRADARAPGGYEMDVTDDSFTILVKSCPPTNWFKDNNLEHYHRYCEHCDTLYRRVGERCGFQMEYIPPDPQKGTCCGLRFTEKE